MDDPERPRSEARVEANRSVTYVAAILVEALVIAGLYLFGRYFSA